MKNIKIRVLKTKKGYTYTYVHESPLQSIITDLMTILTIIVWGCFLWFNYQYLGNSLLIKFLVIGLLVVCFFAKTKSSIRKYTNTASFLRDIEDNII